MLAFVRLIGLGSLAPLAGCAGQPVQQAIDVRAISKVQNEIKRQVGVYVLASQQANSNPVKEREKLAKGPGRPDPNPFWCGTGDIDLDISQVKAELTTTLDVTQSAGLGATVSVVEIGGAFKTQTVDTQNLVYNDGRSRGTRSQRNSRRARTSST